MYKIIKRPFFAIFMVLQIFILVGCGGGSSSGGQSDIPNSNPSLALTVEMKEPHNGAIDVQNSLNIQLNFSKPVVNVTKDTVTLHSGSESGPVVKFKDIISNSEGDTYTFTLQDLLVHSTKYYVVVHEGITTVDKSQALTPTTFNFTTGVSDRPTVSDVFPEDGATDMSTSLSIQVVFSEPVFNVNKNTVTLHKGSESGPLVDIAIESSADMQTYTFNPPTLNYLTKYYLVLTSGVTAVKSNAGLMPTTYTFTTSPSLSIPMVSMINPANDSTIKDTSPIIQLHFSEPLSVDANQAPITLHKGGFNGQVVPTTIEFKTNQDVEIRPVSNLTSDIYYVVIENGLYAINSNTALAPTHFNFIVNAPIHGFIASESGVTTCNVTESGNFTKCRLTLAESNAYSITPNIEGNYAYVVERDLNKILLCPMNRTTGELSSEDCAPASETTFNSPTSIAINPSNTKAYITNYSSNSVSVCNIEKNLLTNCAHTGMGFIKPSQIILDSSNKNAYITNEGNNSVYICPIDQANGTLPSCSVTGTGFTSPMGLTFGVIYPTNLYVANKTSVSWCTTSGSGNISACKAYPGTFTKLNSIAPFRDEIMYAADAGKGMLSKCVHKGDGSTTCTTSGWYTGLNTVKIYGN